MKASALLTLIALGGLLAGPGSISALADTYTFQLPELVGEYVRDPLMGEFISRSTSLEFLQQTFLEIDGLAIHVAGTASSPGLGTFPLEGIEMQFLVHDPPEEPMAFVQIPCDLQFEVQNPFDLGSGESFNSLLQGDPHGLYGTVYVPGLWPDIWPPVEPAAQSELTLAELIVDGTLIPEPSVLALLVGAAAILRRRSRRA